MENGLNDKLYDGDYQDGQGHKAKWRRFFACEAYDYEAFIALGRRSRLFLIVVPSSLESRYEWPSGLCSRMVALVVHLFVVGFRMSTGVPVGRWGRLLDLVL